MATSDSQGISPLSIEAGSDLSASQFCAVTVNSDGQLALPSAGATIVGILLDEPAAQGRTGSVQTDGAAKWRLGGTVDEGDEVKTDSTGRAVTASAADVLAGYSQGKCLVGGATNAIGTIKLRPQGGRAAVVGVQALTDSGTINATTEITTLAVTGTDAYTLSDGLYVGQRKIVRCISASGSPVGVITPTTVSAAWSQGTIPATLTMNTAGQEVTYEWQSDGWAVVAIKQAGVEVVAHTGTSNPLVAIHQLTVSGTDDGIIPSGMFTGQMDYWTVTTATATPIQSISGLFYDEDGSADGIDVNFNPAAAGDNVLLRWSGTRWFMVNHINATIST